MGSAENEVTLSELPLGGRLLVRSRKDWRLAVISRIAEERITLSVASPTGRNYWLGRLPDARIAFDGGIPFLLHEDQTDTWRENFSSYDQRW